MTDTEKAYAYEMRRRQTIGNYLARMSNLGYGNSVGVGIFGSTDDQDRELENQTKDLEPPENAGDGNGAQKMSYSGPEDPSHEDEEAPIEDSVGTDIFEDAIL